MSKPVSRNLLTRWSRSEDSLVRVFRNSSWLFSAKGLGAILSIFYLAILTRTLGVAGFGEFMVIVGAVQVLTAVLKLQTWQAVVQFGVPFLLAGQHRAFRKLSAQNFWIEFLGGLAACAALWLMLPYGASQFGWSDPTVNAIMGYGVIVFLSVRSTPIGILRAQDRFGGNAFGDAIIPVVRFAGALVLVATLPSMTGFLIVWGLSEFISFVVMWLMVWRRKETDHPLRNASATPAEPPSRKEFLAFLLFTNLTYLVSVIRERLVVVMVGFFVGPAAAGLFRLADQIANSLNRLAEVFARPLFAELSRLFAIGQTKELRTLFWRSLRVSAISGGVLFLGLLLLGKNIISLISGPDYLAAFPILLLLGAATIISLAGLGLEPLLQAAGRARNALVARVAGLVALGLLMAVLLPRFGTLGAAWVMLISAILTSIILFISSRSAIRQPRQRLPKSPAP
ncbi:oligosaccharide flippase family protein [uncultured Parasphingorhabdus sp.]|uniref:lipopolysaccharide biosynthesis protein n=1 Tax=uncultured Parasphingorhabdus sp. TaxID=2709694 RepID=UPI0030DCC891|tara:strand:- start:967 stop:2328 length:1362 start_codon:yes stop_codon:yes gene_type:complete